ncbi:hypothetical protein [Actinomycetospora flava]|uniref:Uncharacterized protein n=1 Tax=Actinomycetospora flava TaxID=3129232 RepID=A0ABU8M3S0_9PSEU
MRTWPERLGMAGFQAVTLGVLFVVFPLLHGVAKWVLFALALLVWLFVMAWLGVRITRKERAAKKA